LFYNTLNITMENIASNNGLGVYFCDKRLRTVVAYTRSSCYHSHGDAWASRQQCELLRVVALLTFSINN